MSRFKSKFIGLFIIMAVSGLMMMNKWEFTTVVLASESDFKIVEGGILESYHGDGGDVTIPKNVTSISDNAFSYSKVTSVIIPTTVTSIGNKAFYYCDRLESISIPNSVTSMGTDVFYNCDSLKSIDLSSKTKSISDRTFTNCYALESIAIPEGITSIGENVFSECRSLGSVSIASTVTRIGHGAFSNCDNIKSITFPNSLTSIESDAFSNCDGLESIKIPSSVTSIGNSAFNFCYKLEKITIPSSVTNIGGNAFGETKWLANYKGDFVIVNGILIKYKGTDSHITISNSVKSIGESAFVNSYNLERIIIPGSVTSIGNSSFYGCNKLTEIIIGNNVKSIGDNAFYGCRGLLTIAIPRSVNRIGKDAFYGNNKLLVIYGVKGSAVNDYAYNNEISYVYIEPIELNKDDIKFYKVGKTDTLKVSGTTETVTWKSTNTKVATVSGAGKVTAVKNGVAAITATINNQTIACTITVKDPAISVKKLTLKVGKTSTLSVDGYSSGITWTSNKKSVATVSKKGVVTGKKAGKAVITASVKGKSYKCTVTVKK